MSRFLAVGECMIEMAPDGAGKFVMGFAGDTFNTAWYARQVAPPNVEIAYLSAVGTDKPSDDMAAFMREAGIVPHLRRRADQTVGLYLVSLEEGERTFSYWRSAAAARTLADDLDSLPVGAGDTVFFSGITLAILPEAGRRRLLELMARVRSDGVTVAFDPNLRPRLWQGTEDMCRWITRGAAVADIALPSFEDEAAYFGDADTDVTAERYSEAGAGLVVVKDGPKPVLIRAGRARETVAPDCVADVVDTTAAGDSFNAAFLMALADGGSHAEAARAGCALSAQVIGRRGALVPVQAPVRT
ncbi:sugar kinase [Citreimonas sp.]|uniref:sugar kinase n=1 Tax=Citreimonas sp. TaxID=3036715 RepID=UPI004058FD22